MVWDHQFDPRNSGSTFSPPRCGRQRLAPWTCWPTKPAQVSQHKLAARAVGRRRYREATTKTLARRQESANPAACTGTSNGDVAKTRDDARRVLPIEAHAGEDANCLVPKRPGRRKNRAMPEAEDQRPSGDLRWPPSSMCTDQRNVLPISHTQGSRSSRLAKSGSDHARSIGEFRGLSDTDGLARSGAHGTIVTGHLNALHLSARRTLSAEVVA
jgi:hypothetical protein